MYSLDAGEAFQKAAKGISNLTLHYNISYMKNQQIHIPFFSAAFSSF